MSYKFGARVAKVDNLSGKNLLHWTNPYCESISFKYNIIKYNRLLSDWFPVQCIVDLVKAKNHPFTFLHFDPSDVPSHQLHSPFSLKTTKKNIYYFLPNLPISLTCSYSHYETKEKYQKPKKHTFDSFIHPAKDHFLFLYIVVNKSWFLPKLKLLIMYLMFLCLSVLFVCCEKC